MSESNRSTLVSARRLQDELEDVVVVDCRFSLADTDAGDSAYLQGHIPGAHYLHLERDLSGPVAGSGGRHPLPDPQQFCRRLAELGITRDTPVVAYDDSRFAFASRLWWMMSALGFTRVRLLDGGLNAWTNCGGALESSVPSSAAVTAHSAREFAARLDIKGVRQAQARGAVLIDSREERRYLGLEEPIDPVAGHIPGAVNYPWQGVTDESGLALGALQQQQRWQDLDADQELVVYCGSGVTACVNLLSLRLAGRRDAQLYSGSWSDWCSWL
jgi:thiosulfate/3-mercaptopyruvate sulfurtransferase